MQPSTAVPREVQLMNVHTGHYIAVSSAVMQSVCGCTWSSVVGRSGAFTVAQGLVEQIGTSCGRYTARLHRTTDFSYLAFGCMVELL